MTSSISRKRASPSIQDRIAYACVGLTYVVSQGDITATIIWFAISTGITAGLSYYKERE